MRNPLEPDVTDHPDVVHVRIYGVAAKGAARQLGLAQRVIDPALVSRFSKEADEERRARSRAGLSPFIPQRHPFAALHDDTKGGIPDTCVSDFVQEVVERGYFLIGADVNAEQIDENVRDVARLVFSRKEEDRACQMASPTTQAILRYFGGKIWGYVHVHDNRRIHPATETQIGNNVIDLVDNYQRFDLFSGSFNSLHFHDGGKHKDGVLSYERIWRMVERPSRARPAPPLTYRIGDVRR